MAQLIPNMTSQELHARIATTEMTIEFLRQYGLLRISMHINGVNIMERKHIEVFKIL